MLNDFPVCRLIAMAIKAYNWNAQHIDEDMIITINICV